MDIKTEYVIAGVAGLAVGARFVDIKLSGAFVAGIFITSQDTNVIIAFIVGYIAGALLLKRILISAAQET